MNDPSLPLPLLCVAAGWHARVADLDPDDPMHESFSRWLDAHPDHGRAYARIEHARLSAWAIADEPAIVALRETTLARIRRRRRARQYLGAAAASFTLLTAGAVSIVALRAPPEVSEWAQAITAKKAVSLYQTGIGERTSVELSDGSSVVLDTDSALKVAFSPGLRRLTLEKGQALFEVAKDTARPFIVTAVGQAITAHGTVFDVRIDPDALKVALLRGKVTVASVRKPRHDMALIPNEILTASDGKVSIGPLDKPEQFIGWRDGLVVFDNNTLAEAVAELGRYTPQHIVIRDPAIAKLRVSGAFQTSDVNAFLEAIESYFPNIDVTRSASGIVISRHG